MGDADATEALAEVWASMDGRIRQFQDSKGADAEDAGGAWYGGYLEDAKEMIERLAQRGFKIVPTA